MANSVVMAEFLKWLQNDPEFRHALRVAILKADEEMFEAQMLAAAGKEHPLSEEQQKRLRYLEGILHENRKS